MNKADLRWRLIKRTRLTSYFFVLKPTMRCNLSCPYCSVDMTTGTRPIFKEITFDEWKYILDNEKLPKLINISGGEPLLYSEIVPLIQYLIDKKRIVNLFTNLLVKRDLPVSWRLAIRATYHRVNREKFLYNLRYYGKNKITVWEFSHTFIDQKIPHSVNKYMVANNTERRMIYDDRPKFAIFAPNGKKYNNLFDMEENGLNEKTMD